MFKQTVPCVHRNADSMPTGSRDVTLASLTLPEWPNISFPGVFQLKWLISAVKMPKHP